MITDTMKEWLKNLPRKPEKTVKFCVYMNRIQKRISRELDNLLWLCIHHPEVFLDEGREHRDDTGKIMSHRRLKRLLLCVKAVNPECDVQLVLANLEFPEED